MQAYSHYSSYLRPQPRSFGQHLLNDCRLVRSVNLVPTVSSQLLWQTQVLVWILPSTFSFTSCSESCSQLLLRRTQYSAWILPSTVYFLALQYYGPARDFTAIKSSSFSKPSSLPGFSFPQSYLLVWSFVRSCSFGEPNSLLGFSLPQAAFWVVLLPVISPLL